MTGADVHGFARTPAHKPDTWGGPADDLIPDINVHASPIIQAANTVATGGLGIVGDGGDALAFTNQDTDIFTLQG